MAFLLSKVDVRQWSDRVWRSQKIIIVATVRAMAGRGGREGGRIGTNKATSPGKRL